MAIEMIPALPDHVIGFVAKGEVTRGDYQATIDPAVEDALTRNESIRLLYVLGHDFERFTAGAAMEDGELGGKHWRQLDRIAVVTDHDWIRRGVELFGHLLPGAVRVFPVAQEADASAWVTEP